jgi:hypothetical protein
MVLGMAAKKQEFTEHVLQGLKHFRSLTPWRVAFIDCLLIVLYTRRRPSIAIFEAVCFYLLGWASLEHVESSIAKTPI